MKQAFILVGFLIGIGFPLHAQTYEEIQARHYEEIREYFEAQQAEQEQMLYEQEILSSTLYSKTIPTYNLEVTFDKTVHIIFPAEVCYIDLGSSNIIAGKADGAGNVVRVKAAVRGFEKETNMSVITEEGSFYSFNIFYTDEPISLNIEMADFLKKLYTDPSNRVSIRIDQLGEQPPTFLQTVMTGIYKSNRRLIKHIGSRRFGIRYLLKSIYTSEGMLFLHTQITNKTNVPLDIDFIRIKVVNKKVAKRTAIQETIIQPIAIYNEVTRIGGNVSERSVIAIDKLIVPTGKRLIVELYEKNGGRYQTLHIENEDLLGAETIAKLKIR